MCRPKFYLLYYYNKWITHKLETNVDENQPQETQKKIWVLGGIRTNDHPFSSLESCGSCGWFSSTLISNLLLFILSALWITHRLNYIILCFWWSVKISRDNDVTLVLAPNWISLVRIFFGNALRYLYFRFLPSAVVEFRDILNFSKKVCVNWRLELMQTNLPSHERFRKVFTAHFFF